jgi:hypothetical protein
MAEHITKHYKNLSKYTRVSEVATKNVAECTRVIFLSGPFPR